MLFHQWTLSPNSKTSDKFTTPIKSIYFHSIKYDGNCLYLWIGDSNCKLENLSCAMQTNYSSNPLSTELIQVNSEQTTGSNPSSDLATKLSKRLNKQVFVSLNVPLESAEFNQFNDLEGSLSAQQLVERRLFEEIKANPDKF